jgi:hypothetical protein
LQAARKQSPTLDSCEDEVVDEAEIVLDPPVDAQVEENVPEVEDDDVLSEENPEYEHNKEGLLCSISFHIFAQLYLQAHYNRVQSGKGFG